ncbi:16S rRNA (cytosine(1402)-N(4))-methyltransferase RsmH [bacterium]|nr:16S rRNA (cytosine(1402)-N(4))-methyltransferase RsmH [bacterium]NBT23824.1 16S rRNA (cytosine(1402)-N(4))-methyltransferase RsmH [bacterium]
MLQPAPGRTIVDATFGRGGHTRALLERGANVVALDVDPAAEAEAQKLSAETGPGRFCFHRMNFGDWEQAAARKGPTDGLLLDLGISSPQVDQAERGFSFQQDGPLDMRMDPTSGTTAAELVNNLSEPELRTLLREGGEDRDPGKIARTIVRARPLATTMELAAAVCRATRPARPGSKHPATRTFLALRRAVNREGESLEKALSAVPNILRPGGRMAVLTYHSAEDRVVKHWIRGHAEEERREMGMAFGQPNPERWVKALEEVVPTEEEISANPRARSARLRGAERLQEEKR